MKRKNLIWLTGVSAFLVAVIILVIAITMEQEPTLEAQTFCEAFPSALFCQEEEYAEIDIAEDMLQTFMAHYPNVMSESFCNNYFYGNLQNYCLEDPSVLVPYDFSSVSRAFDIVQVEEGLYDVRTRYSSFVPAYTIRLALNNMDGAYHISGFSFYDTPATINLALTDEDINTFMLDMIATSDANDDTFCDTYFTWQAKSVCDLDSDAYITDPDITFDYTVSSLSTNRYRYTVSNEEDTVSLLYTILFENVDGTIKISELDIEIVDPPTE